MFARPSWIVRGAGVLLLAAVLLPPWEYYSCCHAGLGFEPHALGSAGLWPLGFVPPPRDGYPTRLAAAEYSWHVAGAGVLFAVALLVAHRRPSAG